MSSTGGASPAAARACAIAASTVGSPPLWSKCQWERNTTSTAGEVHPEPLGVAQPPIAVRADVEQRRARLVTA